MILFIILKIETVDLVVIRANVLFDAYLLY